MIQGTKTRRAIDVALKLQRICPPEMPHMRVYFSRAELTDQIHAGQRGDPSNADPVLKLVLEIPGIAFAEVHCYQIVVLKVPTFEWDEIEPGIAKLLTTLNLGLGRLLEEISNA
jgi:hypothetical protein